MNKSLDFNRLDNRMWGRLNSEWGSQSWSRSVPISVSGPPFLATRRLSNNPDPLGHNLPLMRHIIIMVLIICGVGFGMFYLMNLLFT